MNYLDYPSGLEVIVLDQCKSTNTYIKENLKNLKERIPLLVTSPVQTAGRGRNQRRWFSPKNKGLYSSFAFFMDAKKNLPFLPLISGISIIELIKECYGIKMVLKWPNDIIYKQKKIAGILIENNIFENRIFCIAGMGINLNHRPEDFPSPLDQRAVSLKMITGNSYQLEKINRLLSTIFFNWLEKLQDKKYHEIIETAQQYSRSYVGKEITFCHQDKIMKGIFKGINSDGGLILIHDDDRTELYYSGEILF
jgi:BirA family biotin operon repressor/biotin-[acetyl-CoA-carboxylase] ligase